MVMLSPALRLKSPATLWSCSQTWPLSRCRTISFAERSMLITRAAMRPGIVALSVLRVPGASAALAEALVEPVLAPGWVTAVWAADAAGAADVAGAATGAGAAD